MQSLSLERAVAMIPDGATLMIGGFMAVGTPERVIDEIVRQNKGDLTAIANDTAAPAQGIGKLMDGKRVRKLIASHIGLNRETRRQMQAGEFGGGVRSPRHAYRAHSRGRVRSGRRSDADGDRNAREGW